MDGTAAKSSGRRGEFGSIETLFGSPMLDHRLDMHGPAAKSSSRLGRFSVRCSAGSTWPGQRQSQAVDEGAYQSAAQQARHGRHSGKVKRSTR